ncbi:MAG: hypothetical protein ACR2OZ_06425 [Verrucomicrobiales bacterium]
MTHRAAGFKTRCRRVGANIFVALNLPWVVLWAKSREQQIQRQGRPLTPRELDYAISVGVQRPEKIRVLVVPAIQFPGPGFLHRLSVRWGIDANAVSGLSLRYGIFLRCDAAEVASALVHECVHTAQYERLGGFGPFLSRYLTECLTEGYPSSGLEHEARQLTARAFPVA